ncbi:MAG TPA: tripartite tricarboxylate transporter substrate-binding protein [Alphaproteobacteria bacterium]|nr:tripartite tricarboxylate transporter substrate-binding protein [Alphaproteobacteria bacterium]
MRRITRIRVAAAVVALSASAAIAAAQPADEVGAFFAKNGLRLVVASGSGGGFDVYSRVLSRHYARHLPGNPNIVVQNMPGASGITATNWIYASAPRDGSRILATYSTMLDQNLFGNTKASFDVRKLNWLGSIAKTQLLCVTWNTSPYKDIREMIGKDVTVSATGRTGNTATLPLILNELLGTDFRVIAGYSTSGAYLALERGEVDGNCGSGISTLRAANPDWSINKRINLVLQVGLDKHPDLPDVPSALDLVTGTKRDILEFNAIIQEMGRPYAAPPEVPPARLAALNAAFDATMKDPEFLAEADKLGLDVSPLDAAGMRKLIDKLYAYSPKTVQDVAAMLGMAEKSEVGHCDRFAKTSDRCDAGSGAQ